jgi:hypothetical protein
MMVVVVVLTFTLVSVPVVLSLLCPYLLSCLHRPCQACHVVLTEPIVLAVLVVLSLCCHLYHPCCIILTILFYAVIIMIL